MCGTRWRVARGGLWHAAVWVIVCAATGCASDRDLSLSVAINAGNVDEARRLIDEGADVDARLPDGWRIARYSLTVTWQRGNRHILRLGRRWASVSGE